MFAIVFVWKGISVAFNDKLIEKQRKKFVVYKLIYRLSISNWLKNFQNIDIGLKKLYRSSSTKNTCC